MFPTDDIVPPLIEVATAILFISPSFVSCGSWSVPWKYRFIIDSLQKRALHLRKEPSTDSVKIEDLLLREFWQSAKTVVYTPISLFSFAIPRRIAYFKDFFIPEADLPYNINGKRVWLRQNRSSLLIENTTSQPV
jgi:hypothetical protein